MSALRHISRREFLKRTGQASGGLVFALSFTAACSPSGQRAGSRHPSAKPTLPWRRMST